MVMEPLATRWVLAGTPALPRPGHALAAGDGAGGVGSAVVTAPWGIAC